MMLRQVARYANGALLVAMMHGFHCIAAGQVQGQVTSSRITTANGVLEGLVSADGKVRTFKGVPYAAPPVGSLRWKAPQPAPGWDGVRKAVEYGPRCMQGRVFDDMVFHDNGPSEDCLYLNLWMPASQSAKPLPVMVWIYGGGFVAGATSEPRQDGGNLSKNGVLVVSLNYRLGIFGFFSHPELTRESEHGASGNYGLLDQVAALQWVKKNIATFGGDPNNITIFGESAGSFSVSALMASPLSRSLFHKAIGESGAFFSSTLSLAPLAQSEKAGAEFAQSSLGAASIEALRAKPADEILQAASKGGAFRFGPNIDGYFLPKDVYAIFAAGQQARVPLLAGWNADESNYRAVMAKEEPTVPNFAARVHTLYGSNADALLKLYAATSDPEARRAAQDLAGDQFIAYSTWKWIEMHQKTSKATVFRYRFDQTLPLSESAAASPRAEPAAPHACEIEFVFGMLSSRKLPWRPEDRKLSDLIGSYWTNFAKTGDPNGASLPQWPAYFAQDGFQVMHLSSDSHPSPDIHRARYEFLDSLAARK